MKISKSNKFIIFYSLFTLSLQQGSKAAHHNDQTTPPEKKPVARTGAPTDAFSDLEQSRRRASSLSRVTSPLSPTTKRKSTGKIAPEDMIIPFPRKNTPRGSQVDLSGPYVPSSADANAGSRSQSPITTLGHVTSPLSTQEKARLSHNRSRSLTGQQDFSDSRPRSLFTQGDPTPQEEQDALIRTLAATYATHIALLKETIPQSAKAADQDHNEWARQKMAKLEKEAAEEGAPLHEKVETEITELLGENLRMEALLKTRSSK